ncbi:predicted protein [Nematostella vectensis]|uniref:Uncharacterized protein n=1 Tax=Nematostella vectensis TaxID=45351 RepID=A7RZ17_NEMVE|nr:predicted protein [Nematostella vectensis]|eukprot:XP_001635344.1 predicted protein [Nematostella vectensis]
MLNATFKDGFIMIRTTCDHMLEETLRKKVSGLELESVEDLKSQVHECKEGIKEWKKEDSALSKAKEKLNEEMIEEIDHLDNEIDNLDLVNKELSKYINNLHNNSAQTANKIDEVGKKQQGRKIRQLENKARYALWYCKHFGLELKEIKLKA